jgi:AAA family ATP:ADP antiporter
VLAVGVALPLAFLPALTIAGFGILALTPTIAAIAAVQVVRRAADYAIARPAREMLYTVVPREDRYKAKSMIDTVVYRTGDQVGAWAVALLRVIGLAPMQVSLVAIPVAVVWLTNALWLGRRQERRAAEHARLPHAEHHG